MGTPVPKLRQQLYTIENQESFVARFTGDLLPDRRSIIHTARAPCCLTSSIQQVEQRPVNTGSGHANADRQDAVMRDTANETETDILDDFPEARDPAVSVTHAAERLIANQMEAQQAKLAVFRAFSTAFYQTADQFTSGHSLHALPTTFHATFLATGTTRSTAR
ncbi:hypothetical protein CDD83_79 [Cordyceps sp. RAO-2017]|nr:hypothetical protein CDD83_79 [Cordyceps sp. RAO-2017]